jgi:hypothetical protein
LVPPLQDSASLLLPSDVDLTSKEAAWIGRMRQRSVLQPDSPVPRQTKAMGCGLYWRLKWFERPSKKKSETQAAEKKGA